MSEEKTYARVVLTGIDIPFGELVKLLVKITLASIPAVLIFSVLAVLLGLILTFLLAFIGFGFG